MSYTYYVQYVLSSLSVSLTFSVSLLLVVLFLLTEEAADSESHVHALEEFWEARRCQ